MRSLKALILMAYYNRPKLVCNALQSVLAADAHHSNWELVFGDDGSTTPGRPIAERILRDRLDQVTFLQSGLGLEEKISQGLALGRYANDIIKKSDADFAIILCDDDELHPLYLKNLNAFFNERPDVLHCYSQVHLYNPFLQKSSHVNNISGKLNSWSGPINPEGNLDASQVAWRLACCKEHGAWFADSTKEVAGKPWARDTDRAFFRNLAERCGPCQPTGFVAQYKGIHDYQLLWHKNATTEGLRSFDEMSRELAGVEF